MDRAWGLTWALLTAFFLGALVATVVHSAIGRHLRRKESRHGMVRIDMLPRLGDKGFWIDKQGGRREINNQEGRQHDEQNDAKQ